MRDDEITGLYYDLKAPYEVLVQLDEGDTNAIGIGRYLEKALDMLDLRDPYSATFYASVAAARRYMKEEFYESFCQRQPVTVDCVGHDPHRRSLALDAGPDAGKSHSQLCHRQLPDGPLPRVQVPVQPAAAL